MAEITDYLTAAPAGTFASTTTNLCWQAGHPLDLLAAEGPASCRRRDTRLTSAPHHPGEPTQRPAGDLLPGRKGGKMARKYVRDVFGEEWEITQSVDTGQGFPMLYGVPHPRPPKNKQTRVVIISTELVAHIRTHRFEGNEEMGKTLPLNHLTIYRIRKRLGLLARQAQAAYEKEIEGDLKTMTSAQFAITHGLSNSATHRLRHKTGIHRRREPDWWIKEPTRSMILSEASSTSLARHFDCTTAYIRTLKSRLQKMMKDGYPE